MVTGGSQTVGEYLHKSHNGFTASSLGEVTTNRNNGRRLYNDNNNTRHDNNDNNNTRDDNNNSRDDNNDNNNTKDDNSNTRDDKLATFYTATAEVLFCLYPIRTGDFPILQLW